MSSDNQLEETNKLSLNTASEVSKKTQPVTVSPTSLRDRLSAIASHTGAHHTYSISNSVGKDEEDEEEDDEEDDALRNSPYLNVGTNSLEDDIIVMDFRRDESKQAWIDMTMDHLNDFMELNGDGECTFKLWMNDLNPEIQVVDLPNLEIEDNQLPDSIDLSSFDSNISSSLNMNKNDGDNNGSDMNSGTADATHYQERYGLDDNEVMEHRRIWLSHPKVIEMMNAEKEFLTSPLRSSNSSPSASPLSEASSSQKDKNNNDALDDEENKIIEDNFENMNEDDSDEDTLSVASSVISLSRSEVSLPMNDRGNGGGAKTNTAEYEDMNLIGESETASNIVSTKLKFYLGERHLATQTILRCLNDLGVYERADLKYADEKDYAEGGLSQEQIQLLVGPAFRSPKQVFYDVDNITYFGGDVVEVRDEDGEWESGVVTEIKDDDDREEVMVMKDLWDTAYCWDEIRHLDLSGNLQGQCPGNHRLSLFRTDAVGYTCSRCARKFERNFRLFGCRICDFDLCEACIEGKGRAEYKKATKTPSSTTARERAKEAASRLYTTMLNAAEQRRERNLKLREERLQQKLQRKEERARQRELNKKNKKRLFLRGSSDSSTSVASLTSPKSSKNNNDEKNEKSSPSLSPYLPASKLRQQLKDSGGGGTVGVGRNPLFEAFEDISSPVTTPSPHIRTRASSNSSYNSTDSLSSSQTDKYASSHEGGLGEEMKVDKDWLLDEAWSLNKGNRSAKQSVLKPKIEWARQVNDYDLMGQNERERIMKKVFPAYGYERLSMRMGKVKVSSYPKLPKVGLMAGIRQRYKWSRYPRTIQLLVYPPCNIPKPENCPLDLSCAFMEFENITTGQKVRTDLFGNTVVVAKSSPSSTSPLSSPPASPNNNIVSSHGNTSSQAAVTLGISISSSRDVIVARLIILDIVNGEQWVACLSVLSQNQGTSIEYATAPEHVSRSEATIKKEVDSILDTETKNQSSDELSDDNEEEEVEDDEEEENEDEEEEEEEDDETIGESSMNDMDELSTTSTVEVETNSSKKTPNNKSRQQPSNLATKSQSSKQNRRANKKKKSKAVKSKSHALLSNEIESRTEFVLGISDRDCSNPWQPCSSPPPSFPSSFSTSSDELDIEKEEKEKVGDVWVPSKAKFGEACQVRIVADWVYENPELLRTLTPSFPKYVQLDLVSAVSLVTATDKTKAQRESMSEFLSMQEAGIDVAGVIDRYEAEAKVIAVCEVFNASTMQRFRTKLVSGHAHYTEINERVLLRVDSPYDTLLITIHYHLHSVPKLIQLLDSRNNSSGGISDIREKILKDLSKDANQLKAMEDGSKGEEGEEGDEREECVSKLKTEEEELDDRNILGGDVSSYLKNEIEGHALASAVLDNEATISSHVILPLDERFLRGRACAISLKQGNGESNFGKQSSSSQNSKSIGSQGSLGILELEARWADPPDENS